MLLAVVWIAWCAGRVAGAFREMPSSEKFMWGVVIFVVFVALNVVIFYGLLLASCAVLTGGFRI